MCAEAMPKYLREQTVPPNRYDYEYDGYEPGGRFYVGPNPPAAPQSTNVKNQTH